MNLYEEIKKARRGEPSKVRLGRVPRERLEVEEARYQKGYVAAFGNGFSREELVQSLTPRQGRND